LAKADNSQITLLHVCHTEGFGIGQASPQVIRDAPVQEAKACQAFLTAAGKILMAVGINPTLVCIEGVPAREIINYAQKNNFDLICMTTHGAGEVGWSLGSTADRVVSHSNVPVYLIRTKEFKPAHYDEEHWVP
jgi:nucleotide-binding universal stress UspA family protein